MATINATVTAKTGPAVQATSMALAGYQGMLVDLNELVLTLFKGNPGTGPYKEFDLTGVTTFTVSISGGTYTLTVS